MAGGARTSARPASSAAAAALEQDQCSIRIDGATSRRIDVTYRGLPGNQPKTYKNMFAVWENTVVPWDTRPKDRMRFSYNVESGRASITGLEITNSAYTVAYCTGRHVTDAVACATLEAGRVLAEPASVSVTVEEIGDRDLSIRYRTLYGYLPRTYGNWIGLWPGMASPYNAPKPQARAEPPTDANEGALRMEDVDLAPDCIYTLIYFMGRKTTTAAATCTFRTTG